MYQLNYKLREIIEKTISFLPEKEKKDTVRKVRQRVFQALRIDVNREFEVLYEFMEKLPDALKPGGRVAIYAPAPGRANEQKP